MSVKIAHISDIHFFELGKNFLDFLGKRVIGNYNYLFKRKFEFNEKHAYEVVPLLKKEGVTHLFISGDFTCTSSQNEFLKMKEYLVHLEQEGIKTLAIPGNHDMYTFPSYWSQTFYDHVVDLSFEMERFGEWNLREHKVMAFPLGGKWIGLAIDCSIATPPFYSNGLLTKRAAHHLKRVLKALPSDASIVMVGHYPYANIAPLKKLIRGSILENIIVKDPRIRLYIHGHNHVHSIADKGGHILAESGSISLANNSSFNMISLTPNYHEITKYQKLGPTWEKTDLSLRKHHE